jgi:hypothetical protein
MKSTQHDLIGLRLPAGLTRDQIAARLNDVWKIAKDDEYVEYLPSRSNRGALEQVYARSDELWEDEVTQTPRWRNGAWR